MFCLGNTFNLSKKLFAPGFDSKKSLKPGALAKSEAISLILEAPLHKLSDLAIVVTNLLWTAAPHSLSIIIAPVVNPIVANIGLVKLWTEASKSSPCLAITSGIILVVNPVSILILWITASTSNIPFISS